MKEDDVESVPPEWYPDNHVEVIRGERAVAIDRQAKTVTTNTGRTIPYDRLLLATGAEARKPAGDFGTEDPILTLRAIDDAVKIRSQFGSAKTGIAVGAGFVGLETAASGTQRGVKMTVVADAAYPWSTVVGPEVGAWMRRTMEAQGVQFVLGSKVSATAFHDGKVSVTTDSGQKLEADFAIFGIGSIPNLELATAAGLEMEAGGVKVDRQLRTSDPDIYAAGDIAAIIEPVTGIYWRTEHYMDAVAQGELAGANLVGGKGEYDHIAYFFSDIFDIHSAVRGCLKNSKPAGVLGDMESGTFVELHQRDDGVLAAGIIVCADYNDQDPISDRLEPLIRAKVQASSVTAAQLGLKS